MKVKVFVLNKDHKIELTEKELKELLDDAYWEGYRDNSRIFTWQSPTVAPAYDRWTVTTSDGSGNTNSEYNKDVNLVNGSTAVKITDDPDYGMGNEA